MVGADKTTLHKTTLHKEKGGAFYSGSPRDVTPTHQIHEDPLDCGDCTLGFRTFRPSRQRVGS